MKSSWNIVLTIYFLGILSLLISFATRSNFAITNIETVASNRSFLVFSLLILLLASYFVLFKLAIEPKKPILVIALFLMVMLTISLPIFSTDVGAYLVASKNLLAHHANPYKIPLNQFSNDPWVKYMGSIWWMSYPMVYGPVALFISSIAVAITGDYFYFALLVYKILVLVAVLASVCLFKRLDSSKNKVNTLLFLLNPILLLSILVDGHNDAFVLLSVLGFFYLSKQNQMGKSLLSLLSGIFVKYWSALLLPVFFIENRKINWKRGISALAVMALIFYLFLLAFKLDLRAYLSGGGLTVNKNCVYVCTPLISLISNIFKDHAMAVRLSLFAGAYLTLVIRYLLLKEEPWKFAFWAFIALYFIGSMTFLPWYSILPIACGLLINDKKYTYFALVLTGYSLLFYFGI